MACQEIAEDLRDIKYSEWIKKQLEGITIRDIKKCSIYRPVFLMKVDKRKKAVILKQAIPILEEKSHRLRNELPKPSTSTFDIGFDKSIRVTMLRDIERILKTLNWIKQKTHTWLIKKNIEVKIGYLPETIFSEIEQFVDKKIKHLSGEIAERFAAIYDDLSSANCAKWSNAILSCREILRLLANTLCLPLKTMQSEIDHKLGAEEYCNRLIEFVKKRSRSKTFIEIFGSTLQNFTDRLEAIYRASCKGKFICRNKVEAKRHVIYTYMLVADILRFTS
ncbi:unnamed protein product [marine sediment metagenome]|uniref:Uncharacterized protein n=1 Tax=marine sediment metagenome TaxID=412755 RepID=X1L8N5_9ZZZZ